MSTATFKLTKCWYKTKALLNFLKLTTILPLQVKQDIYGSPKNSKEGNIKTEKKDKKKKKDEKESTRKRRRTCGHFHEDGSEEISESESIQSENHGHQEEKQFKLRMREDMQKLEKRIEELNYQLLKKETFFKANEEKARVAELDNELLKKKLKTESEEGK